MTNRARFTVGIMAAIVAVTSMGVEPVTVTITVTIIIAVVCLVLGAIASFVASWWFSKPPPPVPICKVLTFVRSEREGDDRKCTYTVDGVEYTVMLKAMQAEHPDLQGAPEQIHPRG